MMWAPLMFTTATLLLGGSIGEAGVSYVSHLLSAAGAVILLFTAYISPDWQTSPKALVSFIAAACLVFSVSHLGCMYSLPTGDGGMVSVLGGSVQWYLLTYFGRLMLRLLLGFVAPTDLLLLWTKGRDRAASSMPYTLVVALVAASVSTIVFAASPGTQEASVYACWYVCALTRI